MIRPLLFVALCAPALLLTGCVKKKKTDDASNPQQLGTFASAPLFKEIYPCDSSAKPWDAASCLVKDVTVDLSQLGAVEPAKLPYYQTRIDFTQEDLEAAEHKCSGSTCEATVQKPLYKLVTLFDVEVPITLQATATITYEQATNADDAVALRNVKVSGSFKPISIKKFLTVSVAFGVKVSSEMDAQGVFAYKQPDFFCEARVGLELPYVTLGFKVTQQGIEFNNRLSISGTYGKATAKNPFLDGARISFDDLGKIARTIHTEMKNDQRYNPADPSYAEHFNSRFDDIYGFGG